MLKSLVRRATALPLVAWLRNRRRSGVCSMDGHPATRATTFASLIDGRRSWLFETLPREAAEYQYDIFKKSSQKRLARRLGIPVADEYLSRVPLVEAIAYVEQTRMERFVIKPNSSHSAIGTRCLVRGGDGRYLDLKSQRRRPLKKIAQEARREYARLGRPDQWMLEELLLPADGSSSLLDDYKCSCFGGVVEVIAHKRPIPGTGRYDAAQHFTRDWMPVNIGVDDRDELIYEAPRLGRKIIEVAEAAASGLSYPFIRIDLYDTTRGIVLGEFTPGPGRADRLHPEWDERFTDLWQAAARRTAEDIRSGRSIPLGPES